MNEIIQFKQLEWEYIRDWHKHDTQATKVVAICNMSLPKWMTEIDKSCRIEIRKSEYLHTGLIYISTLWAFSRGISIVSSADLIKSEIECQILTEQRFRELITSLAIPTNE